MSRKYADRTYTTNLDPTDTTVNSHKIINRAIANLDNFSIDKDISLTDLQTDLADNDYRLTQCVARAIASGNLLNCTFSTGAGIDTYTLADQDGVTRNINDATDKNFIYKFLAPSSNTLSTVKIAITGWNGNVAKKLYDYDRTTVALSAGTITSGYVYEIGYDPSLDSAAGAFYLISKKLGTAALRDTGTATGNVPLVGTASATTSLAGLAPLATLAEVQGGTATGKIIDPATLAGAMANSKATNGYTYLPNGLIMQWGYDTGGSASKLVTFPITFPNTCLNVCAVDGGSGRNSKGVNTFSTASFRLYAAGTTDLTYWFAIGY